MNKFMSLLLVSTISITSAFATQNHKHLTMEEIKAMPLNEMKSMVLDKIERHKDKPQIKNNYESIKKCVTEATSKVVLKECIPNKARKKMRERIKKLGQVNNNR